jgi:prepilin peptidase CpaA
MTTGGASALVACGIFAAGMIYATVTDLRHRRIRNWLVTALAICWAPMAIAAGLTVGQMAGSMLASVLVFAAGLGIFSAGWLGGGDVKLAAVAVLWLGAGQAVSFLFLTALLGAALSLVVLAARWLRPFAADGRTGAEASAREVPYGPALALAAIGLLNGSPWSAAL